MSKKKHDVPEELLASGISRSTWQETRVFWLNCMSLPMQTGQLGSVSGCQFNLKDRSRSDRSLRWNWATTNPRSMSKKKHDVPEELLASGISNPQQRPGFRGSTVCLCRCGCQQLFRDLGSESGCQDRSKESLIDQEVETGNHLRTPDRNEQEETRRT